MVVFKNDTKHIKTMWFLWPLVTCYHHYKIVYINRIVQFLMFILVSMLFGYAIGGLLGPPWGTFWYLQIGRDFGVYFVQGVFQIKIKKSKKSNHLSMPFFIKDGLVIAELAMSGLKQLNRLYKADWLGWFCVLYMHLLYNTVRFVKN